MLGAVRTSHCSGCWVLFRPHVLSSAACCPDLTLLLVLGAAQTSWPGALSGPSRTAGPKTRPLSTTSRSPSAARWPWVGTIQAPPPTAAWIRGTNPRMIYPTATLRTGGSGTALLARTLVPTWVATALQQLHDGGGCQSAPARRVHQVITDYCQAPSMHWVAARQVHQLISDYCQAGHIYLDVSCRLVEYGGVLPIEGLAQQAQT